VIAVAGSRGGWSLGEWHRARGDKIEREKNYILSN